MSLNGLLSSRVLLRMLGVIMGLAGIAATAIELHLSVHGFGPFACVLAVYYVHHSLKSPRKLPMDKDGTWIYRRCALILFGLSVIELCLLELATRFSLFSSMEMLGYVGGLTLVATFCLAALCFMVVLFRFFRRIFSNW